MTSQKQYLLITLLINLLILFKWTLLENFLRSLVIKSLIDNILIERLGFKQDPNLVEDKGGLLGPKNDKYKK